MFLLHLSVSVIH